MAPPPPPPWLFSERDARDLRRLKKPLFLDSRFFSAASWTPGGGAFAPGSLEEEEEEEDMEEEKEVEEEEEEKEEREEEEKEEEFGLRQDVTSLPATGPSLPSHLKLSLMTFLQKKSSRPSSSFPIMPFCSDSGATLAAAVVAAAWAEPR